MSMLQHSTRAWGSPSRYIQGRYELENMKTHTEVYGRRVFFLIDVFFFADYKKRFEALYAGSDSQIQCEQFGGQCTEEEILRSCRTAFSGRMDDAVGDGDAALAFASIANGGVIAIGRGFYRSAIDGNGHCPGVINSGSADAEALSLGSCLDRAAVDDDAAALIRPDSVSGDHPVQIFCKVVDAPNGGYIAAVDGDRAAISCGDRIAGSLGDDRAAVDGDAAAITAACADPKAV